MGDDEKQVLFNNQKKESHSHSHAKDKDDDLQSFRSCLRWMCVDQSNPWWASLSWLLFFLLAIIVPTLSHFWLACADCDGKLHRPYDGVLQLSLTSIATVSFLCLSKFVRKYGLRRFLYLDKLCDESEKVRHGYTAQLHET
ncbi:putative transmembrane protein [Thalictrum thalictroides]|uniref:Putative transmembrane protein n=1 Tax=Thalictrum thalictroides TaxID=46969 RepID=A0A7J6XE81_THATH|nr:putative transmembrane protein [Thalictrum thalictroides]